MNEKAKVIGGIAIAALVLLFAIPAIWHAGIAVGHLAAWAISKSGWILSVVAFLAVIAVPIVLAVIALTAIGFGVWSVVKVLKTIASSINDLAKVVVNGFADLTARIDGLQSNLKRTAKESAIDAGFVAALAVVCALVAFLTTNDWLKEISSLKILAAAALSYAALKFLALIPYRPTKIGAAALTLITAGVSIAFVNERHPLTPFANLAALAKAFASAAPERQFTACLIAALSVAAVFYPFTPSGWKKILGFSNFRVIKGNSSALPKLSAKGAPSHQPRAYRGPQPQVFVAGVEDRPGFCNPK